jgi:hypothetical protein
MKIREVLWMVFAVIGLACTAPGARADGTSYDVSANFIGVGGAACASDVCTLGGEITIDSVTGLVTSVNITFTGGSPARGPFDEFVAFVGPLTEIRLEDSDLDLLNLRISGNPGTLVGFTGGNFANSIVAPSDPNSGALFFQDGTGTLTAVTSAPEPSSEALMFVGISLLFVGRKRFQNGFGLTQ